MLYLIVRSLAFMTPAVQVESGIKVEKVRVTGLVSGNPPIPPKNTCVVKLSAVN